MNEVNSSQLFALSLHIKFYVTTRNGTCSGSLTHLSIFQKPNTITLALHAQLHTHLMFVYLTYLTSYWFPLIDLITVHTHYMHVIVRNHTALAQALE